MLLSCFAIAIVGDIAFSVSPEQNPWLFAVLAPALLVAGVGRLAWCRTYTAYVVQNHIERARHIYEGLSGRFLRRFMMSERFWRAHTLLTGLFLAIAGIGALAFLMMQ